MDVKPEGGRAIEVVSAVCDNMDRAYGKPARAAPLPSIAVRSTQR
jgi:hypothetical protein